MEEVSLRDEISDDGLIFNRPHLYDHSRHILHTEESEDVIQKSCIKYDPNADGKAEKSNNIEYVLGHNKR